MTFDQSIESNPDHPPDGAAHNRDTSTLINGGRRRRASHRRSKHHRSKHRRSKHRRSKHRRSKHRRSKHRRSKHRRSKHRRSKRRGGTRRRGRRGGAGLAQMVVPFGLIALQQVIGERGNQKKLRRLDSSLGRPGTSVIKGAVNIGTGVVKTGLGVVQSVLPGRKGSRTRRRKVKRGRKSRRR